MPTTPPRSSGLAVHTPPARITRRHAPLCLAGVLLLTQLPACASRSPADGQPVFLSIVDRETGQTMTTYRKDGRSYVAGRPASRYTIRLANQTGGRVLVVLAVDGVNVISGETASVGQTGYVLEAWQSYDIAGWRKSDTAIASFVFAALGDSYAARTGRPGHVGVIGMAAFLEKPAPQALRQRHALPSTADRLGSVGDAESRADALVAETDAENGELAGKLTDRRHRDSGFGRRTRPGRDHQPVRRADVAVDHRAEMQAHAKADHRLAGTTAPMVECRQ